MACLVACLVACQKEATKKDIAPHMWDVKETNLPADAQFLQDSLQAVPGRKGKIYYNSLVTQLLNEFPDEDSLEREVHRYFYIYFDSQTDSYTASIRSRPVVIVFSAICSGIPEFWHQLRKDNGAAYASTGYWMQSRFWDRDFFGFTCVKVKSNEQYLCKIAFLVNAE